MSLFKNNGQPATLRETLAGYHVEYRGNTKVFRYYSDARTYALKRVDYDYERVLTFFRHGNKPSI